MAPLNFSKLGTVNLEENAWKACPVCGLSFQSCNSEDVFCSDKCSEKDNAE
jgi:predicted nucleic acid-binding Zn ribbon protein